MATPVVTLPQAEAKLQVVREQAAKRFGRPGVARGVAGCPPPGGAGAKTAADPRLLDYIYEVVFSALPAAPAQGMGGKEPNLDAARDLVFTLPEFKIAAEQVAYSEDLLTRAVTLLEGVTRCRLCGSNNTTFTVRPVRSSDEAPTSMIYCGSCGHRTTQTGE